MRHPKVLASKTHKPHGQSVAIYRALLSVFIATLMAHSAAGGGAPFDLIIRHGTLLDGSGQRRMSADIGIIRDRIVSVGNLQTQYALT
ncbi:MAG: hypothetical protein WCD08_12215, partial [Steroidobacteraceae bacterium]